MCKWLCSVYRQQTGRGQRVERLSLTLSVSHLLSALLVMDCAGKLAALQGEAETERMREGGWKKREECNLLTPSLKEPFTCVDTLE